MTVPTLEVRFSEEECPHSWTTNHLGHLSKLTLTPASVARLRAEIGYGRIAWESRGALPGPHASDLGDYKFYLDPRRIKVQISQNLGSGGVSIECAEDGLLAIRDICDHMLPSPLQLSRRISVAIDEVDALREKLASVTKELEEVTQELDSKTARVQQLERDHQHVTICSEESAYKVNIHPNSTVTRLRFDKATSTIRYKVEPEKPRKPELLPSTLIAGWTGPSGFRLQQHKSGDKKCVCCGRPLTRLETHAAWSIPTPDDTQRYYAHPECLFNQARPYRLTGQKFETWAGLCYHLDHRTKVDIAAQHELDKYNIRVASAWEP